jgi:hypothetical protein
MCTPRDCQNRLCYYRTRPEGFLFQRVNCGQVFLVPRQSVGMELYDNYNMLHDCNECRQHLVVTLKYDNGFIFRCAKCGRMYRLYLMELIQIQGNACC